MSNLLRWDPLRELGNLRKNMNRILEEGFSSIGGTALALDMYETEDMIVIETNPIPGISADDIEVSITGNVLTIKGKSTAEHSAVSETNYLRKERRTGGFSRSITIPRAVQAEDAVASFKDNMLTISIPKAAESRPQVIDVRATEDDD